MSANDRCSRPRKILIICQYFVPYAASVGVVARVVHLARFLNDCGCEVHILTSDGADFGDLGLGDFLSELNITYLSDPLKKSVQERLLRIGDDPNGSASAGLSLLRAVKRFLNSFILPDLGIFMVPKYYRTAVTLAKSKEIDTVIVSTPPHSMQLVGGLLKQRFGERIELVVDYRDSWNASSIFAPRGKCTSRISRWLEEFTLRRADIITCASQPMLAKLTRLFPDRTLDDKCLLMMNGYAEQPCPIAVPTAAEELRIGYFGMANDDNRGYRNVQPLLHVMALGVAAGLRIRLVFYGSLRLSRIDIRKFPFVEVHRSVPHGEVLDIMRKMDYLLILHTDPSNSDEVITGKFFDYLRARRPILCFMPRDAEAVRLAERFQVGAWLDSQTPERALEALASLKHRQYPGLLDDRLVSSFSRREQYAKLYARLAGSA